MKTPASDPRALEYQVRWRPSGTRPGATAGTQAGAGQLQRALVLLRDHPDARRLDLRATLRDPLQRLWVRDFHLNASLKVVALVDMSASMGHVGTVSRLEVVRDVVAALALSAWRAGDAFGVYAANASPIPELSLPPRINRGAWSWANRAFSKAQASGDSARGLLELAPKLPARRSLVFVVSDFRWPEGMLRTLLLALQRHQVVPLVLQDPTEGEALPTRGITLLRDAETGGNRFVWLRPALSQAVIDVRTRHRRAIESACRVAGCRPLLVHGRFDPLALTRHLAAQVS